MVNFNTDKTKEISFISLINNRWQSKKTFVCVGLDSDYSKIPSILKNNQSIEDTIFIFNKEIIDATQDLVCAYKPNLAFYSILGEAGVRVLKKTIDYIKISYSDIPVIFDAKKGDIGNTNLGYVAEAFDFYQTDAITVHPYLGHESLQPFLDKKDKGIFVLVKTSNEGSNEFQNLLLSETNRPLYLHIASQIVTKWNHNHNCAVVVGANYPDELRQVREIVGDTPILIPGIGIQGGEIESTVKAGKDSHNQGMIINSSRGIIFASNGPDFAKIAREKTIQLRDEINSYL